jgi:translocation and assembly module TamB
MKRLALVLVALLVLAAGALLVASRSDRLLAWGLEQVEAASGGRIRFEDVSGDFAGTPTIGRVRYADESVVVEVRNARLDWTPLLLALGRLEIASLSADEIDVTVIPSETPSTLPTSLALPLVVNVGKVEVPRVVVRNGDTVTTFEDVRLTYAGDGTQHRVSHLSGRVLGTSLAGEARLGATPPFEILGSLAATRPPPPFPVQVDAKLGGTLEAIAIDASVQGEPFSAAKVSATIAPFADRWLEGAKARVEGLDLARLAPALPRTQIELDATAALGADDDFNGTVAATNADPGPVDKGLLPVAAARTRWRVEDDRVLVLDGLTATAPGGGRASGTARLEGERVALGLDVESIDLARIVSTLRTTALAGRIDTTIDADGERVEARVAEAGIELALRGTRRGDVLTAESFTLRARDGTASGRARIDLASPKPFSVDMRLERFDPAALGDYPSASLSGTAAARGRVGPPWSASASVQLDGSRFRDLALAGGGTATVSPDRVENADVALIWGGTRATAKGSLGRASEAMAVTLDAKNLAELDRRFGGRASGTATLSGALRAPLVTGQVKGESLVFPDGSAARFDASGTLTVDPGSPLWVVRTAPLAVEARAEQLVAGGRLLDRARAKVDGTLAQHRAELEAADKEFDVATRVEGGFDTKQAWSGTVTRFENRGRFPVRLETPAALELAPGRVFLGPLTAAALGGSLRVRDFRWEAKRLTSSGDFTNLAARLLVDAAGLGDNLRSTLLFGGDWSLTATPRLNGTVRLRRERGDLEVLTDPVFPLGLEQLELSAKIVEDRVTATAVARGVGIGALDGTASVEPVMTAEGLRITLDSPLVASLDGALPSLRPFAALVGPTILLNGALRASLQARGTLRQPLVTGELAADRLQLLMPAHGVDWNEGRLRAQLTPTGLDVSELVVRAGGGTFSAQGRLPRSRTEGDARVQWRAERFLALARPDRRLVASGEGTAAFDGKRLVLRGRLSADEGNFELSRSELPTLPDDVVVLGEERAAAAPFDVPLKLDLDVDFGQKLRVSGFGLETLLGGKLRVGTTARGQPTANGTVTMRQGTFRAYGQNLRIEQGRLTFDGPIENPALQVTAWRRNQAVEAGVEVTGTVRNPRVRIVSEPSVPEGEALSWLVLGRGPDLGNRADLAALQVAAATLNARSGNQPLTRQIARTLGLDDISFSTMASPTGTASPGTLTGNVVTFGKRLSDRLYLLYEQAIAGTGSVVKLDFLLTRNISLRAEAGTRTGGSINYRYSFD